MGEYIYDEERALNTTGTIAKFQGKEAFMIEGSHVYTRHAREYIKNNTTGYYMYDLRHSDGDWSRPYWLQRYGSILVNYFGVAIMREPIKIGKTNDYTIRHNGRTTMVFTDMTEITLKDYLEGNYERID